MGQHKLPYWDEQRAAERIAYRLKKAEENYRKALQIGRVSKFAEQELRAAVNAAKEANKPNPPREG